MNNYRINKKISTLLLLIGIGIISCKKDATPPGTSSLIVMNAIAGSTDVAMNFNGIAPINYLLTKRISYNTAQSFSSYSGIQPLGIFEYPDTTADHVLYNLSLSLPVGSITTLILTGSRAKPDSFLIHDDLPYYPPGDSVMGIRLIHAAGIAPVKVVLKGDPQKELAQLSFKKQTSFFKVPVLAGIDNYVFEFRDAITNTLIASYTANGIGQFDTDNNPWLRRNISLVLTGNTEATGAQAPAVVDIRHSR